LTSRERGGGIALDATVHDVDLLRFVLGAEVESVVGLTANQGLASDGVEDAVMTVLRFEGGILAICHDAWNVPGTQPRMTIHGSRGTIEVTDPMAPDERQAIVLVRDGERRRVPLAASRGAYLETIEAFGAAVAGRGQPSCTGRDGIASLAPALAARGSASAGR
jgi:1,5-anhydro-D-fructose reductase (1,5-anhydro-D-mannitol-forming)